MGLSTQVSTAVSLGVTFGLLACVIGMVVIMVETRKLTTLTSDTAHLASELRQSSDDLTRFVRTFVVTGNHSYWDYYLEVVNIRNGMAPLPNEPWRNHWDIFLENGVAPRGYGTPQALRMRIQNAQFTPLEVDLLDEAQRRSDKLIDLETVAYNAILGRYRPTSTAGLTEAQALAFSVTAPPNQTLAMELVHGVLYHREKGNIMRPLDEFAAHATQRVLDRADVVFAVSLLMAAIIGALATLSGGLTIVQFCAGRELQRALRLAQAVAERLHRYDTDKATDILAEALDSTGAKDAKYRVGSDEEKQSVSGPVELIGSALVTITENMKMYRPHLPNWVIEQTSATSDGDDDETDGRDTEASYPHSHAEVDGASRSQTQCESIESSFDTTSRSSRQGHTKSEVLSSSGGRGRASKPRSSVDHPTHGPAIVASAQQAHNALPHRGRAAGEISRVVAALLHFDVDCGGTSGFVSSMHAVADAVHAAASSTAGAVHGFSCDTVVVSWGAARRVVQPDAKAATFMLKVRAALAQHVTAATVSGAALAGEARPLLAGRGAQQALTMFALWRPALEAAAAFARDAKALLVGPGVEREARFATTLRGVAAIHVPEWSKMRAQQGGVSAIARNNSTSPTPAPTSGRARPMAPAMRVLSFSENPTRSPGSSTASVSLTVTPKHGPSAQVEGLLPILEVPQTAQLTVPSSSRHSAFNQSISANPRATTTLELYELVGGRSDAQDEWLYVVNNKGGEEHAKVERAFTLGLAGGQAKGQEGLAVLHGLGVDTLAAPTVQHLRRRLQAVADGRAITITA